MMVVNVNVHLRMSVLNNGGEKGGRINGNRSIERSVLETKKKERE